MLLFFAKASDFPTISIGISTMNSVPEILILLIIIKYILPILGLEIKEMLPYNESTILLHIVKPNPIP